MNSRKVILQSVGDVLKAEAHAILNVPLNDGFVTAVTTILKLKKGKVVVTGIGKAGHVAKKFAATLCSTTTPATFLHPAEAAHGDLGIISKDDCIVAFSTSGKSREVLEMLELARHLGVKTIIGITSHPDSELRKLANIIVDMGEIEEPCPLGLTPSATIAAMLAISDAIALTIMKLKKVTREQYGLRHHGGYLGRKARQDNT